MYSTVKKILRIHVVVCMSSSKGRSIQKVHIMSECDRVQQNKIKSDLKRNHTTYLDRNFAAARSVETRSNKWATSSTDHHHNLLSWLSPGDWRT